MLQRLARWHDQLSDAGLWLSVAALAAIAGLSFAATMSRYFLGAPIGWVADGTGYLLVLMIFVATPAVTRRGMHVSMDLLSSAIRSNRWLTVLSLMAQLLTLAILGVLCAVVLQSLGAAYRSGTSTAAAYPIPRWWLMSLLLYGFAGSALHLLRGVVALLPRPRAGHAPSRSLRTAHPHSQD